MHGTGKHKFVARVPVLLSVVLLCTMALSCNDRHESLTESETRCKNFLYGSMEQYKEGKHRRFLQTADSFFAANEKLSTYCYLEQYRLKIWYYFHNKNTRYDSALLYTDSVIYVIEKNKLTNKLVYFYTEAFASRGEIYYNMGDFDSAYSNYFKARALAEQSKDVCVQIAHCYGLGMISYKQKKYREAADYFKATYLNSLACDWHPVNLMQEALDNTALCFEKLKMPDSAVYYYDSALSFITKNMGRFDAPLYAEKGIGVVLGNLGSVYMMKGETDSAIDYFKKSYAINIRPTYDASDALLTHLKLAGAWLKKNDLAALAVALPAIRKELDTIEHSVNAERDWNGLMYKYSKTTGNVSDALKYHEAYAALQDSLTAVDNRQQNADVDKSLRQKEQAYQISLLKKQNSLNNLYLWVTIIILLMALFIIWQVYSNYKKGRRNIQALTALNNQVSEQKAELEKRNKEKDRILHMVAHDLRNPVGAIFFLADEMLTESASAEEIIEVFGMIKNASESASALISELLGSSNDLNGEPVKEPAELNQLIRDTLKLLRFKANEKHQVLEARLPGTPLVISLNKEQIARAIGNLVVNAMKFSAVGATVTVSVTEQKSAALITIRDTGIGIPANMQEEVFNMFTKAKRPGTAGERSFGLGLSICKQIIDAHHGKIWFESTEGSGTTFFIEIPK